MERNIRQLITLLRKSKNYIFEKDSNNNGKNISYLRELISFDNLDDILKNNN